MYNGLRNELGINDQGRLYDLMKDHEFFGLLEKQIGKDVVVVYDDKEHIPNEGILGCRFSERNIGSISADHISFKGTKRGINPKWVYDIVPLGSIKDDGKVSINDLKVFKFHMYGGYEEETSQVVHSNAVEAYLSLIKTEKPRSHTQWLQDIQNFKLGVVFYNYTFDDDDGED